MPWTARRWSTGCLKIAVRTSRPLGVRRRTGVPTLTLRRRAMASSTLRRASRPPGATPQHARVVRPPQRHVLGVEVLEQRLGELAGRAELVAQAGERERALGADQAH